MKFADRLIIAGRGLGIGRALALLGAMLVAAGCSPPEEQAQAYYEKGQALLAQGENVRAALEFRNAIQIRPRFAEAWYGLALVEEQKGDAEKLLGVLTQVLEADPRHRDALIKRGRLLFASEQAEKALLDVNAALAVDSGNVDAKALRAAVLFGLGDRDTAVAEAREVLQVEPENGEALMVLAAERLDSEDYAKAIEFLDAGIAKDERNVALQAVKIQALEKMGRGADSEAVLRRLVDLFPEARTFRHALAEYLVAQGRAAEAENEYRGIMAKHPADTSAKLELVQFLRSAVSVDAAAAELQALVGREPENDELRFTLAEIHTWQGKHEDAARGLERIISDRGTAETGLTARSALAMLRLQADDEAGAEDLIRQVLAVDPRNADALVLRATIAVDRRAFDDAIADLRTVLRDNPYAVRVLVLLAKAHELAGAEGLAEDYYVRALQASRGEPAVGMEYVKFLTERGAHARAQSVLESILAAAPDDVEVLTALAEVHIAQGNGAEAEQAAAAIRAAGGAREVTDRLLGVALAVQGRGEESIEILEQAHMAAPNAPQPMLALVRAYGSAGKGEAAKKMLLKVLQDNPDNHAARLRLGQLELERGEGDAAEETFRELVRRAPGDPAGHRALAALYTRQGRADAALAAVERGLEQLPGDFSLRLSRATVYHGQGNFENAISEYEAMLKEWPSSQVVANDLASLLSDHRQDEASLKRALQLAEPLRDSTISHFRDTVGWAHYRLGNYEEAISALRKAVDGSPGIPLFRYHLGMAFLGRQDTVAAKRELEAALELAAQQPLTQEKEIREALGRL